MSKENVTAAVEAEELPRTIVRRVVKDKLSELSGDGGDIVLHKEALLAFSDSARIFIHYLSATANDICSESKRQIINAEDVLKALEEIEFSEFVEPLREALDELKKKAAGKRAGAAKAKEDSKKRKTEKETTLENGGGEGKKSNEDNEDEDEEQAIDEGGEQATDDGKEPAGDDGKEQANDEGGEQASDEGVEQVSEVGEEPGSGD